MSLEMPFLHLWSKKIRLKCEQVSRIYLRDCLRICKTLISESPKSLIQRFFFYFFVEITTFYDFMPPNYIFEIFKRGKASFCKLKILKLQKIQFLDIRNSKKEEILVWKGRKAFYTE